METKQWQIPYPMENWKMRYIVVWIQNHDKFIVLIWKTLDMRFGCKIRINSLQCTIVLRRKNIGSIKFISARFASPDMNFIDPIFFRIRTIVHCVTNNIEFSNVILCSKCRHVENGRNNSVNHFDRYEISISFIWKWIVCLLCILQ